MKSEQNNFFCNILDSEKNDYLNLVQLGWEKCTPNYSYSNFRDLYLIFYVKKGSGTIECDNQNFVVHKDDSYIFRPNILSIQRANKEDPFEIYFFAFDGKLAPKLIERTIFRKDQVAVSVPSNNLCDLIKNAAENISATGTSQFEKLEYLFKLLSHYDLSNSISLLQKSSRQDLHNEIVYNVKKYIQLNYSNKIRISDIASRLNINRSHLYRIFKENTGTSIEDYIISVRINEAKRFFQETDLSSQKISEVVGYFHYSSFFNAFKQKAGMTPQQYRKKYQVKKVQIETLDIDDDI